MSSEKPNSWKTSKAGFTSRNFGEVELVIDMLNNPDEFLGSNDRGNGKPNEVDAEISLPDEPPTISQPDGMF